MNNKWYILVLASIITILNGCQTSPKGNVPEWLNNFPPEEEVWGIGTGENKDLAIRRAQEAISRQLSYSQNFTNVSLPSFFVSLSSSSFTSWVKENNISSYTFGDNYIDGVYWYGIAYKIPENIRRNYPRIIMPVVSLFTLERAVVHVVDNVRERIPEGSKIAIVNISAANRDDAVFVIEELSTELVKTSRENEKKFTIVDRRSLDAIRRERNLQLSGDVSDETIVSIGKFLGANVVITGSITGANEFRRLRVKALDVETARLLIQTNIKY